MSLSFLTPLAAASVASGVFVSWLARRPEFIPPLAGLDAAIAHRHAGAEERVRAMLGAALAGRAAE